MRTAYSHRPIWPNILNNSTTIKLEVLFTVLTLWNIDTMSMTVNHSTNIGYYYDVALSYRTSLFSFSYHN